MNSKKWLFSFGVLLLGTPFLVTQAGNVEMVQVKTVYTKPIDVRVDSKGLLVTGKAWLKNANPEDARIITAQLIDEYGAEVWKKDIPWDPDFLVSDSRWTTQQIVVPFSHDFAKESVAGDFEVVFTTRNRKNKLTAKGSREISLIKREPVLKISDLKLKSTEQETTISFSAFKQGEEPQEASKPVSAILPRVTVFEHVSGGRLVYSEKGKALELNGNENTTVSFKIPKPEQPESYVVEVQLFDKKDNPLTGILSKRLLVEGDFAEITSFTADPERFLETGESVTFSFIGVARKNEELLTMKIEATQKFRNKVINKESKKKEITEFDFAEFTESFTFPIVEPGASQFEVEVELIRDGKVIEEKFFTTEQFTKYGTPAYQAYDTVMSYGWLMWLVIAVVVIGLGLLIWKLRRRSKIFNLLFLGIVGLGMFSGVCQAEGFWNDWSFPVENANFNPQSEEGFQYMRFEGDLYALPGYQPFFAYPQDPDEGELTKPSIVNIRFLQGEEVRPLNDKNGEIANFAEDVEFSEDFLFEENIQIEENMRHYLFEVFIPEDTFQEGDDGSWTPQIYFQIPMGEGAPIGANVTFTDGDEDNPQLLSINIDTQAPTITFTYNPDNQGASNTSLTKDPIAVTITCGDGEGSGCYPVTLNPFEVKGNFGEGFLDENNGFEICDQVKNCTNFDTTELEIDFYDPVPPSFSGVMLQNGNITLDGEEEGTLASSQSFTFTISNPEDPTLIDPAEYGDDFDSHACGPVDESDVYLQQPVTLSWTSGTEDDGFTGFEIKRKEGDAEWISLTESLDGEVIPPKGLNESYSFVDYSISNVIDFEYLLKSNSSGQNSSSIEIDEEVENEDLGDVEIVAFSAVASSKRCTSKSVSCAIDAIERGYVNTYQGEVCLFIPLPGDGERERECSEGGLFPLCFPFNLFSTGSTLPFTLPFTLSGD